MGTLTLPPGLDVKPASDPEAVLAQAAREGLVCSECGERAQLADIAAGHVCYSEDGD